MATQVQLRRGTTAENDAFTGAVGELTVDTTLDALRIHDGTTAGGHTVTASTTSAIAKGLFAARPAGTQGDVYLATDTNVFYVYL